jgi:serine/threonine-protein kinase HipA
MEASEGEFAEKTEFAGMPEEFNSMSTGKTLLVRRFDHGADETRCT